MFLEQIVYVLLTSLSLTHGRTTIRVALFDDIDQTNIPIDIQVPNVTVCNQRDLHLHLYWINSSNSLLDLLDQLESEESLSDVYLARTGQRRTALIEAFCHTHNLPFIDLKSFASETGLCPLMTYVLVDDDDPLVPARVFSPLDHRRRITFTCRIFFEF